MGVSENWGYLILPYIVVILSRVWGSAGLYL